MTTDAKAIDPMALHMACATAGLGYSMGWVSDNCKGDYEVELRAGKDRLFYQRGGMLNVIEAAIHFAVDRTLSDA